MIHHLLIRFEHVLAESEELQKQTKISHFAHRLDLVKSRLLAASKSLSTKARPKMDRMDAQHLGGKRQKYRLQVQAATTAIFEQKLKNLGTKPPASTQRSSC